MLLTEQYRYYVTEAGTQRLHSIFRSLSFDLTDFALTWLRQRAVAVRNVLDSRHDYNATITCPLELGVNRVMKVDLNTTHCSDVRVC